MKLEKSELNYELDRFNLNIEKLNRLLEKYPEEKKQQMMSLIQSKDNRQAMSHLMELYVFNRLNTYFQLVEVEKVLDFANQTTPDFWINNEIAVEVGTAFKKVNVNNEQIIKILNNLKGSENIINLEIKYSNSPKSIKLKEMHQIALQLSVLLNNQEKNSFQYITSQGIELTGNIVSQIEQKKTNLKLSPDSNDEEVLFKYKLMVQRNIRRKLGKYKPIATEGYPLIFVLYDYDLNFTEKDYIDIIYGMNQNPDSRLGPIFSSLKYTSLSAIIGYSENEKKYILFKNPYARNSINSFQITLDLAFGF